MTDTWAQGFQDALDAVRQVAQDRYDASEHTGLDYACRNEVMRTIHLVTLLRNRPLTPGSSEAS